MTHTHTHTKEMKSVKNYDIRNMKKKNLLTLFVFYVFESKSKYDEMKLKSKKKKKIIKMPFQRLLFPFEMGRKFVIPIPIFTNYKCSFYYVICINMKNKLKNRLSIYICGFC